MLEYAEIRHIARLFSSVVDAKSPFTATHSERVAALARQLGVWMLLDDDTLDKLELAGLFHDLGKLRIPNAILEKPGALTPAEQLTMRRHSFESYQILARVPGLEDVASWAAYHHEALDGSGYPYHLEANKLPLPARIIAIADVFQALAQHRPYRASLTPDSILSELQHRTTLGQLDRQVVGLVKSHLDLCWQIARSDGSAMANEAG